VSCFTKATVPILKCPICREALPISEKKREGERSILCSIYLIFAHFYLIILLVMLIYAVCDTS
jgi:hypothetical protein